MNRRLFTSSIIQASILLAVIVGQTSARAADPAAAPTPVPNAATPPPASLLQDAAEIERRRAEKDLAVTDAKAAQADAKKRLSDVRSLVADILAAEARLASVVGTSDEAIKQRADLSQSILTLEKQLLVLDPLFAIEANPSDATTAVAHAQRALTNADKEVANALDDKSTWGKSIADLHGKSRTLTDRLYWARHARCQTAYCFGDDGTEYAFEPMLELPIGTSFAFGSGALARFNDASEITIQFSAGLRFWFWHDWASVSVYFAKPVYGGDSKVHVPGSSFEHPTTSIRREGPSLALGLFGDILFVGGGYDVLVNGSSPGTGDPNYGPNQVLSRVVTFSIGIAPFAAIRNVAGATIGK